MEALSYPYPFSTPDPEPEPGPNSNLHPYPVFCRTSQPFEIRLENGKIALRFNEHLDYKVPLTKV